MPADIELRPATLRDADLLLEWRNDPATRAASYSNAAVASDEHLAWLRDALASAERRLYVAEENGAPVGTVRADLANGVWHLSWTVAPQARGRGVAKRMVALLASRIAGPIRAEVKAGNVASARIAEHAGMTLLREANGVLHYERDAPK
jgi:RimJ/RimL family protein N-acetyltransferase